MSALPLLYDDLLANLYANKMFMSPIGELLRKTVVYEITDCLGITSEIGPNKIIEEMPKRPPHEDVWCEYTIKLGSEMVVSVGIWILSDKDSEYFEANAKQYEELRKRFQHQYVCNAFLRVDALPKTVKKPSILGELYLSSHFCLYVMDEIGIDGALNIGPVMHRDFFIKTFGLKEVLPQGILHKADHLIWPAFMSFALLHCKNITTSIWTPGEILQKSRRKAGKPKRVCYRTLKIQVPQNQLRTESTISNDAGPKVKLHLCRGHMRHLTADRYKAKKGEWIFIPAHFKGNKSFGEVVGPRQLTSKKD